MGRIGSALRVFGLEPAQVGSESHSCWVPLWNELVFLGLIQFHIHRIKPITPTMGCAGDGNSWKHFVSGFLLACRWILAWNEEIYTGIFTPKQISPTVTVWNLNESYIALKLEQLALQQQGCFYPCATLLLRWGAANPGTTRSAKPLVTLVAEWASQYYYCSFLKRLSKA